MFSFKLLMYLSIGTLAMLIPIIIQMKWYKISLWKSLPIAVILTVVGTAGTYFWFFAEVGVFNGISFFGAVFIVPVVFLLISRLFRIPYGRLMDLCAPAECVMLAIMKIQCFVTGCCDGLLLHVAANGTEIRFPSQIVELVNALAIAIILMVLSSRDSNRGKIYLWYMVLYGATRFVLNFFRETTPVFLFMGFGSIWGLLALFIGSFLLIYKQKKIWGKLKKKIACIFID